jgi:hypothetical protein
VAGHNFANTVLNTGGSNDDGDGNTWWSDLLVFLSMNCNNYLVVVDGLHNTYVKLYIYICCSVMHVCVSCFGDSASREAAKIDNIYKKTTIFIG